MILNVSNMEMKTYADLTSSATLSQPMKNYSRYLFGRYRYRYLERKNLYVVH